MPRHTPGPPRGPQPGSPARPALPGPCPWRGSSRGAQASCPRSLGPLPPSPPGHGQRRAGGRASCSPCPLPGPQGWSRGQGAGKPLGSEAPGERGRWEARGGNSGQRVNEGALGLAGLLTRPTEPPPQGRAPLPAPGGVQSPEGVLASPETLCFLSSRVCLCLSLCPTSVSLSLHPTLSSHCALGESRGSCRAPPPQLGPPGTRGAGGCSRVIPG